MSHVGSTHRQIIIGIIQTQYDSRNFKWPTAALSTNTSGHTLRK